jgi:hypothetical protein
MKSPRIRILPVSRDLRSADQQARGAAIEQALADQSIERLWRYRVEQNSARRVMARPSGVRS